MTVDDPLAETSALRQLYGEAINQIVQLRTALIMAQQEIATLRHAMLEQKNICVSDGTQLADARAEIANLKDPTKEPPK